MRGRAKHKWNSRLLHSRDNRQYRRLHVRRYCRNCLYGRRYSNNCCLLERVTPRSVIATRCGG